MTKVVSNMLEAKKRPTSSILRAERIRNALFLKTLFFILFIII